VGILRAGQLRHSIIIQKPTDANTYGKVASAWATHATVFAEVMPQTGSEYWSAKQTQEKEPIIFRIRYVAGITEKMRVSFNSKIYDINSVVNVSQRNIEILLVTEEYEAT